MHPPNSRYATPKECQNTVGNKESLSSLVFGKVDDTGGKVATLAGGGRRVRKPSEAAGAAGSLRRPRLKIT